MTIKYGTTRIVLLIGNYAFKFPNIVEWRLFLCGLLGNLQEKVWWERMPNDMMCPVLFTFVGGFFSIMRRAEPLSMDEFTSIDYKDYVNFGIPVENKLDSFGTIDGRIIAVDYGS